MGDAPLFPGFTDGTVQWRAASLQLVNWGGFDGHHTVNFDDDTTLIAGPTGSGKSTVLDAYTALMMSGRVPFNSASNEATSGRARSIEQRSVLTYLRGKLDMQQDASGARSDRVLRGERETVWGGIAMTFKADDGHEFSAIRVYLARPSAVRDTDVLRRMFTLPGPVDLRAFHDLHAARFQAHVVKGALPGIEAYDDNYSAFSDELFRKLGISGGQKALELLARVQAGKQVKDVTSLFRELVLERPQTYEMADRALGHFSDLERLYDAIATDALKQKLLEPMVGIHQQYTDAMAEVDRLDTFGVRHAADQPFDLWAVNTRIELCRGAIAANRAENVTAVSAELAAAEQVVHRDNERDVAEGELRDGGGDVVTRLNRDIEQARVKLREVKDARAKFDANTQVLGVSPSTADTFAEITSSAGPFLRDYAQLQKGIDDRAYESRREGEQVAGRYKELREEIDSFRGREGLVPPPHDRARRLIAQECGLDVSELPFAAELIDLRPDCEEWRIAAEVTLRGVGLTMLMDERRQAEIRRRIDPLDLPLRIQFNGVDLSDCRAEPEDPEYVSGRLVFKEDSPFVWWVKRRVFEEDHLCVDSPTQLGGDARKVTRRGQTSSGARGAHGRNRNQQNILGFSNEQRVRDLEQELSGCEEQIKALAAAERDAKQQLSDLRGRQQAYIYAGQVQWDQIDVDGVQERLTQLEAELAALLRGSDKLAQLTSLAEEARRAYHEAVSAHARTKHRLEELDKRWGQLIEDEDALTGEEARLQSRTSLSDEVAAELTARLAESEGEAAYGPALGNSFARLRAGLRKDLETQDRLALSLEGALERIFKSFNEAWPDPNRGSEIDSYDEFAAIYEQIVGAGLYERKNQFQRKVTEWSRNDLIQLRAAYGDAGRDVERRLEPINETLSNLPFGAGGDRLKITMSARQPELVREFLKQLRGLTDDLTDELTYEAAESRYRRLLEFMARLRGSETDGASHRDALLDVRRHIEITARRVDNYGNELSTYTTLAGKSGGESQELIAFISGAALRFQLADDSERKPRFAPVFLDEGFVKADSEHAGRAVEAWRELGFQLILAVPLDKVTGLDRHIKLRLSVNKHGDFSRVTELREHREPAGP